MLVFFYPQFKKLTGAERLILKLADYTAQRLGPGKVTLLTHRFAQECRPALGAGVRLIETGQRVEVTGNHYLDAAIEYASGPALALRIPTRGICAIIFFGPPSVPAMWFARRFLFRLRRKGKAVPMLYFCFEPPRFIYSDTSAIVKRLGATGKALRPVFTLYRLLDRYMVGAADKILSNSPYGSRRIWRAYRRRSVVIEHGVDFPTPTDEQIASLRARYALEGKKVVVTVNHLHPRKRIDLFLRSVHLAARRLERVTALVVGDGPERHALEGLARELGMQQGRDLIFAGAVPEEELPAHYALGSVYVHTGLEESFGLSVIEALALALPVVSVDEGGPRDTVQPGISGYLVPATPEAVAQGVVSLLTDPGKARRMGQAGASFAAEHFSWERGVDTLLRLLRRGH